MLNIRDPKAKAQFLGYKIRNRMRLERILESKVTSIIDAQARLAARIYRNSGDMQGTISAVDSASRRLNSTITAHYRRVGEKEARDLLDAVTEKAHYSLERKESTRDRWRARYMQWVQTRGADQVVQINNTTKGRIRDAILLGRSEGKTNYDISKEIYGNVSGIGKMTARVRARTISRTETHFAAGYANYSSAEESPFQMEKEWLPAEDERTRPTHNAASLIGYENRIPMKERFRVGNANLMYPGDPDGPAEEVINCRCVPIWHTSKLTTPSGSPKPGKPPKIEHPKPKVPEPKPKDEVFTDLNTTKEVQDWLTNRWSKPPGSKIKKLKFDLSDTVTLTANEIGKAIDNTLRAFPELAKGNGFKGIQKRVREAGEKSTASFSRKRQTIEFNRNYFRNPDKLKAARNRSERMGWHPKGTNVPGQIAYHELGHAMEEVLLRQSATLRNKYLRMRRFWNKNEATDLSQYGMTKFSECFAEAFCQYMVAPPSKWASYTKKVAELIKGLRK